MHEPIKERARGRWAGILPACGISPKFLVNRHGPCPLCGGKDRYRYSDKDGDGMWICNQCGAGDGVSLVMKTQGLDFKGAVRLIEQHIGAAPVIAPKRGRTAEQARQAKREIWASSHAVCENDPVWKYLHARCGNVKIAADLRTIDQCRYHGDPPSYHPTMLAMTRSATGEPGALHRTYLTNDGAKAAVDAVRRFMPGGISQGSAVRLMPFSDALGIAEGIETAYSAAALFGVPCWAALNAGQLKKWIVPSGVKTVVIFGDNDASFAGNHAAYELAERLCRSVNVEVRIPPIVGQDWNDVYSCQANTGDKI